METIVDLLFIIDESSSIVSWDLNSAAVIGGFLWSILALYFLTHPTLGSSFLDLLVSFFIAVASTLGLYLIVLAVHNGYGAAALALVLPWSLYFIIRRLKALWLKE